jgi:hypothetical protein
MRARSIVRTTRSVTLTSCWTTSGSDSVALGARSTLKALSADADPRSAERPMTMARQCRYWPRRRPLRARLPLDRVDPAQRGGRVRRRCSGSLTRPRHGGENSAGGVTRWCGASLARATRTRSAASITVPPIGPNACVQCSIGLIASIAYARRCAVSLRRSKA